jgi:hypothetical protein
MKKVFIWSDRWPNYTERMMWLSAPWNLKIADDAAEQMSLVPKD